MHAKIIVIFVFVDINKSENHLQQEGGECRGGYHYPVLMGVVVVRWCRVWFVAPEYCLKNCLFEVLIPSFKIPMQPFLKLERTGISEKCHSGI